MAIVARYIGSGDLRESIAIQSATKVQDAVGGETVTWANTVSARAKVEPIRGMEAAQLAQSQAQADYRFWIRWRDGIAPEQRVVWRSREFDILSALSPGEERRYLELMCKERFVGEAS